MEAKDLRYIVFALDTRQSQYLGDKLVDMHSGAVFCDVNEARRYAINNVEDESFNRFVIGTFLNEPDRGMMYITQVETYGFRHDKVNVNQLKLFR